MAAVLYLVFWAIDRRNSGGAAGPAKQRPRGPIGPDDDENFLRNLDRERRRNKDASKNDVPPEPPTNPPSSQENHDLPE